MIRRLFSVSWATHDGYVATYIVRMTVEEADVISDALQSLMDKGNVIGANVNDGILGRDDLARIMHEELGLFKKRWFPKR